ncbi:MAG: hypothetical protein ISS74_11195 [Planctomycetes bacterium]|nr:hypothetical protein [Planctomycetota bacterium]
MRRIGKAWRGVRAALVVAAALVAPALAHAADSAGRDDAKMPSFVVPYVIALGMCLVLLVIACQYRQKA